MARTPSTDFKWHWYQRAQNSIANAALTNSKRPECFVKYVYPTHLYKGLGCHVWDTQGKRYTDYICGLGTNLLGYANPEVNQAIVDQMGLGACLSLGTDLEVKAAEKVKEMFPFIQKLRFLKTGSEACSAAVRIARTYTGKNNIYSNGYHGWHDAFCKTEPALGVPDNSTTCTELYGVERISTSIVEPVMLDNSPDHVNSLKDLPGIKIFDEIITGFRYKNHSVSKNHGITPDLICLGKAIANGMPLAVVGGRTDIMECDEYFVSSTYAGETLSLAAAIKTIELLQTKHDINDLWAAGGHFIEDFNSIWDGVQIKGYNTRGRFEGSALNLALFFQESCKAGLLFGPSWFYCFPHVKERDNTLKVLENVFMKIKNGMAKLEGEMPSSPFAERVRNGINTKS